MLGLSWLGKSMLFNYLLFGFAVLTIGAGVMGLVKPDTLRSIKLGKKK